MCERNHTYTVEVIGKPTRYIGTDEDEAISALLTIDPDYGEEGYVAAEMHEDGDPGKVYLAYVRRLIGVWPRGYGA